MSSPWHVLLGPLPPEAVPERRPVAPPEVLEGPHGWAVAGWEQLVLHLWAGPAGSRTSLVMIDAEETLLAASDAVLYRIPPDEDRDAPVTIHQDSVGGRFEPDGSFRGTRWRSVAFDPGGKDELDWNSTPSEPTDEDVAKLRALVAELIRRRPRQLGTARQDS